MLEPVVIRRSYRIDVDERKFERLLDVEDRPYDYVTGDELEEFPSLLDKLDRIEGVSGIEYDGHFSPSIFFDILDEDDAPEVMQNITQVIQEHLDLCDSLQPVLPTP